jgi:hypothetical protein
VDLPCCPSSALLGALFALPAIFFASPTWADGPGGEGTARPATSPGAPPPAIELAPEDQGPPPKPPPILKLGTGATPDTALVRSLAEQRFRGALESLAHTSVGGYGELMVTGLAPAGGARDWKADARRLVLFVAHSFTQDIRVYTELELEHVTQAEIEQAYVDWKVAGDYLGLRAGLVLVPMGIVNEVHEPPAFNGVQRPSVETAVIPSTWRAIGGGFFGHPIDPLRYELYAQAGLDPTHFTASGFGTATGTGEVGTAKAWALTARVEYEPILGLVLGASGYASDAGKNGSFYRKDGTAVTLAMPVLGYSLDARIRRAGLECKLLYTEWHMPDAGSLLYAYKDQTGLETSLVVQNRADPPPTLLRGGYAEVGYDVLHPARLSHQLVPFVRFEAYDTQAAVPQGSTGDRQYDVREVTMGASYRPIREVVVKADYMRRRRQSGVDESQANFGIGFMY